jgi:hypothetical protein
MKKVVLLAAFSLLGSSLVSCDNDIKDNDGQLTQFNTDDGSIPVPPPPPPPPILSPKPKAP